MRTIPRWTANERPRNHYGRVIPHSPIRTMEEVARELNMIVEQVYHAHASAVQKIRAALSAWGYHREER